MADMRGKLELHDWRSAEHERLQEHAAKRPDGQSWLDFWKRAIWWLRTSELPKLLRGEAATCDRFAPEGPRRGPSQSDEEYAEYRANWVPLSDVYAAADERFARALARREEYQRKYKDHIAGDLRQVQEWHEIDRDLR